MPRPFRPVQSPSERLEAFKELVARVAAGDRAAEFRVHQSVYLHFRRALSTQLRGYSWRGAALESAIDMVAQAKADAALDLARAGRPVYSFHRFELANAVRRAAQILSGPGAAATLDLEANAPAPDDVEATILGDDELARALAVVRQVRPDRYGRWFWQSIYRQLPTEEIAAESQVRPATVRVGIFRARLQIAGIVAAQARAGSTVSPEGGLSG